MTPTFISQKYLTRHYCGFQDLVWFLLFLALFLCPSNFLCSSHIGFSSLLEHILSKGLLYLTFFLSIASSSRWFTCQTLFQYSNLCSYITSKRFFFTISCILYPPTPEIPALSVTFPSFIFCNIYYLKFLIFSFLVYYPSLPARF